MKLTYGELKRDDKGLGYSSPITRNELLNIIGAKFLAQMEHEIIDKFRQSDNLYVSKKRWITCPKVSVCYGKYFINGEVENV